MRALSKDGVEPSRFAHDPHAELCLVLLTDLSNRIVSRKPSLEGRGRDEQHAGKSRPDEGEQAYQGNHPESTPAQPAEEIASGPQSGPLGFFSLALLPLRGLFLAAAFC